jgi:hypothetical protein
VSAVIALHFCAGIIVADGFIIKAAPILARALDHSLVVFADYCKDKGWKICEVRDDAL